MMPLLTSIYNMNGSLLTDEVISGDRGGAILYRPKTQETRQTYEILLNFIQVAIGDKVSLYYVGSPNFKFVKLIDLFNLFSND